MGADDGLPKVWRLADLSDRDPFEVMVEINIEAGRPIWRPPMAIWALSNLIEAAVDDTELPGRRRGGM